MGVEALYVRQKAGWVEAWVETPMQGSSQCGMVLSLEVV